MPGAIPAKTEAQSYYFEAGWNASGKTDLSIPMGAGSIVSSADDLSTVLNAIFSGKIISKEIVSKMATLNDDYGYGLFKKNSFDKITYTHDGAIDGFNSYFYYLPQEDILYILLSNAEDYKLDAVNNSILSIVLNQPITLPAFNKYYVSAAALDGFTGSYTSTGSSLIIDISNRNHFLLAQPRGQRVYTMDPVDENKFTH